MLTVISRETRIHSNAERLAHWAGRFYLFNPIARSKPVSKRIYVITDLQEPNEPVRLVNASNPAQALGFVSKHRFGVKIATPRDVAVAVKAGVEVENDDTEETQA